MRLLQRHPGGEPTAQKQAVTQQPTYQYNYSHARKAAGARSSQHPLDEVHEGVVDACAVGHEEARAWGERVEEEEVLLHAQVAVVTLLCLHTAARQNKPLSCGPLLLQ
jgi:hypothetical protein